MSKSNITKKDVLEFCDKETRLEITQDCHNGDLLGDTKVLNNQGDYRQGSKHDPVGVIPMGIWANCTKGTKEEIYDQYQRICGEISWGDFGGYVRELVKQGILIKS